MQDVVAELRVGVKDLAAEDRTGWTPLSRSDRVRDLVGLTEAMQVELVRGLASWDRVTAWAEDGAVTAVSWLKANAGLTGPEATGLVRLARLYDQHRCLAAALDGGDLTLAKARHLGRAERNHEALFAECVEGFVKLAASLGNEDFKQVIDQWIELVDDKPPPDDSKRRWTSVDTIGGSAHTDMFGSSDDAALMRAAIEALDTPDPVDCPEGPRSRQQRHYDIVIDIFRRALADELGDVVASPTSADIILDAETAAQLVADPDQGHIDLEHPILDLLAPYRDHDGPGDRFLRRRCQHADGTSVRRSVAAATLCNGWVRRIIRDPHTGNVLDVGRAHRDYGPSARRALAIRDGGCVFPGCDRKPKWCDAHHLEYWEDGGLTDLDNGVLLCRRHHTLVHHRNWRLRRDPTTGIVTATAPDGREVHPKTGPNPLITPMITKPVDPTRPRRPTSADVAGRAGERRPVATEQDAGVGDGLNTALGRIDELGPVIAGDAAKAEELGHLTDAVVDGMRDAGLFGALVPADLGGLDLTLPESVEVFRAVAEHDASTAWTLAILADGPLFGRLLGREAFAELVVDGTTMIAGSLNPLTAAALPAEGGYRLSGTVNYASGCHHADWLMVAAWVERDGTRSFLDGIPELLAGIIPMSEATILDTWSPSGMRATGSDDCQVDDVFVAERFTFPWGDAPSDADDVWSRIPLLVQIGGALSSTAVGAARGALRAFVELAGAKFPAASFDLLADRPQAQVAAGEAEGLVLAAEATLAAAVEDVWQQGEAGRPFETTDRALLRSRAVTATRLAAQAVDLLHDVGGMSAVAEGAPLERAWRDIHTATQHLVLSTARYAVTGRILLGRDPGSPVI